MASNKNKKIVELTYKKNMGKKVLAELYDDGSISFAVAGAPDQVIFLEPEMINKLFTTHIKYVERIINSQ